MAWNDKIVSVELGIGELIKLCRNRAGWSQKQLAEIVGVSVYTIINYETGKTIPDLNKLKTIDRLLNLGEYAKFRQPNVEIYLPVYTLECSCDFEITSETFLLYGNNLKDFSCFEIEGVMYLVSSKKQEPEELSLLKVCGESGLKLAVFDREEYVDPKTKKCIGTTEKVVFSVLGEIKEFNKRTKTGYKQKDSLIY